MKKFKKSLIILLSLLLVLSLASCKGTNTDEDAAGDAEDKEKPAAVDRTDDDLFNWMKGGSYYMEFTSLSTTDGVTTSIEGAMAQKGEDFVSISEMTMEGTEMKGRTIVKDDKMYIVDDIAKTIAEFPVAENDSEENTSEDIMDYADMKEVGSGTGEVNGKMLPYKEYKVEGAKVRYYYDGKKVYAIETEMDNAKNLMIIKKSTNKVPSDIFDLPEGYTEIRIPY